MKHVLIATGGTGGHVYPALAVAEELMKRGVKVSWMGTRKGLEEKLVTAKSIPLYFISVTGLRGKGLLGWLQAPFKLSIAVLQALSICIKHKPDVVLGMGGFVSGPGGLASWLLRKPLVIHEQNTIAGMTNKLLANFATHVAQAFPHTFKSRINAIHVGNPVRKEIADLLPPEQRFKEHQDKNIHVLVLGGSLGAMALNKILPSVFNKIKKSCSLTVVHQTGLRHLQETKDNYANTSIDATVMDYIENISEQYNWADIVICRAGALTISELSAAGLGAVLIPYPFAVDDHQYYNAKYLVEGDAAVVVRQSEIETSHFLKLLEELLCKGRSKLLQMAENARLLAMPDAASKVADLCCNLMAKPEKGVMHG